MINRKQHLTNELNDLSSERICLSGLINHGEKSYFDVADILNDECFTCSSNLSIFLCIKNLIEEKKHVTINRADFNIVAQELGFDFLIHDRTEKQHLNAIWDTQVEINSIRTWCAKLKKLYIARELFKKLTEAQADIESVTGGEPVEDIINLVESKIFGFTQSLYLGSSNEPEILGNHVENYIEHQVQHPCTVVGISTGYKYYDKLIGNGIRRKGVALIGSRMKVGKSTLAINIGLSVSKQNIPVLYLDTEMAKEDNISRIISNICYKNNIKVCIDDIETGHFAKKNIHLNAVRNAGKEFQQLPFHYLNVSGKNFDEIISIMRKWIFKNVGFDDNGRTNPCLIMYDYIKLMSSESMKNLQEHQALGFLVTAMHNFSVQYDIPILAFCQLNRDGIQQEDTNTVASSDRILWLISSFGIFKRKSPEEVAQDGPENGNRKMVILVSRFGPGHEYGNYTNMQMYGQYSVIEELDTKNNLAIKKQQNALEKNNEVPFNDSDGTDESIS